MLDNIKWAAGEFHCALGSSNPSRIRRTNQKPALSSLQPETGATIFCHFSDFWRILDEGHAWQQARSELTHLQQRTAGNSGEQIVRAFGFCLFRARSSPAEHAEEENRTPSRQRSSAGRPRCRCETTEGCWDVASSTNDASTGHRGGEAALCCVAFQSLTSCSPAEGITLTTTQRYDTRGKVLGVTCACT